MLEFKNAFKMYSCCLLFISFTYTKTLKSYQTL